MNYKELLEKARETYESEDTPHVVKAWLLANIIYPADESEDERIRKELIEFLKLPHSQFVGNREHEKWIAWLEKQGEQTQLDYEHADIPQKDFAPIGGKKLDAGKVIEWLYNHLYTVRDKEHESCHHVESAPFMGEHITQTEFVEKFKQDFDL